MSEIVLEHLKRIQADLSEVKRDVRELKSGSAMVLGLIGELVKAKSREEERFAGLEARVDRIENRLDLRDEP